MTLILYIENPKDTTRKSQELINEFSKVTGYKITTQKSLAFLYINNEKSEREIKETIPFTTATKRIKYLEINLLKETNDLYADNTDERHWWKNSKTIQTDERYQTEIQTERDITFLDWKNQQYENEDCFGL